MFSPKQLYDYLRYQHYSNKKKIIIRNFDDGSTNPLDLFKYQSNCNTPYIDNCENLFNIQKFHGFIDMYDQEPIDIHHLKLEFSKSINAGTIYTKTPEILKLNDYDFVEAISASMHCPIICHSEKNSTEVNKLVLENNFIDIHYWCHAMISRYWYSEFKLHIKNNITKKSKKFGIYARDFSGTRKYRKKLLMELSKINKNVFYRYPKELRDSTFVNNWCFNEQDISSDSSAFIHWPDHVKFDIHVVAETLFNTSKVHLTEKVFKPIVMYQPFILFAGPGSLSYMRSYGFKTFNSVWDESYDLEFDSEKRFTKIIKLINDLNNLNNNEYNLLLKKAHQITEHNRNLFFSECFNDTIMNELFDNLNNAIEKQKESFTQFPGGTLFSVADKLKNELGQIPNFYQTILNENLKFCNKNFPTVAKDIIKKYSNLL